MRYWHVDAFTEAPFHGNPAAVVLVEGALSDPRRQALALELSLPATVFVQRLDAQDFAVQWYTPGPSSLCGHGTLATLRLG